MASESQTQRDLQRLGANRIEALLVAHLLRNPKTTTASIISATGLRQPEVSVGVRQLRVREWLLAEPIPREGKGRPMHRYVMQLTPADVVEHYRKQGRQMIAELDAAIAALQAGS